MKELRGRKAMKAVTGKASEGARHEDELDARQDTCLASNSSSCRASSFAGRRLKHNAGGSKNKKREESRSFCSERLGA